MKRELIDRISLFVLIIAYTYLWLGYTVASYMESGAHVSVAMFVSFVLGIAVAAFTMMLYDREHNE